MNKINKKNFICPRCGKEIDIKDAIIRSITISSNIDNRYGYNPYFTRIVDKFYKVRFCKRCNKILNINHILRHIFWFILPLLVMCILSKEITFLTFILPIACSIILHPLAIVIYRDLKMKIPYTHRLLSKAKRGNAIEL